ncbi:lipopolysaccharide biosynthesis protein [Pseudonocardia sp. TMWB2A]
MRGFGPVGNIAGENGLLTSNEPQTENGASGKTGLQRIVANTVWLLAGKGFGGVLSFVYLGLITRTLGVTGFGQFSLIVGTAQMIVAVVTFQTWQVVVRYAATYVKNSAASGPYGRLIALASLFDVVGAVAGCLIAWGGVYWLAPYFGWDAELSRHALIFCCVMLLSIKSTPMGILRVENRFDLSTYADAVIPLTRMIGAGMVLAIGPSISGFLWAWAAAELACALVYWGLAAWQLRGRVPASAARKPARAFKENVDIGSFLLVTNLSSTVTGLSQNLGMMLIGFFVSPAAAGFYRLANQLSGAMTKISGLLSRTIFAEVNLVRAQEGEESLQALFRKASRALVYTSLLVVLLVAVLGQPVLLLMSGREFLPAYPLLLVLAAAASVELAGAMFEPVLMSGNRARTALNIQIARLVLLVLLLALLLPWWGAMGAAMATLLSAIVRMLMLRRAARSHLFAG